jgi:hypothetical protein
MCVSWCCAYTAVQEQLHLRQLSVAAELSELSEEEAKRARTAADRWQVSICYIHIYAYAMYHFIVLASGQTGQLTAADRWQVGICYIHVLCTIL